VISRIAQQPSLLDPQEVKTVLLHLKEKQPLGHLQRPGLTWLYRSWSLELHSLYTSIEEWHGMNAPL